MFGVGAYFLCLCFFFLPFCCVENYEFFFFFFAFGPSTSPQRARS